MALAAATALPAAAAAEPSELARLTAQALSRGDEATVAHLGSTLGAEGLADCLESGRRAEQILCAEGARYLERPLAALPVLAAALRSHDRHVASTAAESMTVILSDVEAGDLGAQEVLPETVEDLLRVLGREAADEALSTDVRAMAVAAAGSLARVAGAGLAVSRAASRAPEAAVRRAAVAALFGSAEADDIAALGAVTEHETDPAIAALAAAGVCEVTARRGRALPAPVEARIRALLGDARARPSVALPLLTCLARSPATENAELRGLAARHPNEATRDAWRALIAGEGR